MPASRPRRLALPVAVAALMIGTSACGLCGRLAIESTDRRPSPPAGTPRVSARTISALPERLQPHQTVFAGAFGHTYGHERVFGFGKDRWDWKKELDTPGARSMTHLARFMNALKDGTLRDRVPDQSLVDGEGKAERFRSDRVTAFRDSRPSSTANCSS